MVAIAYGVLGSVGGFAAGWIADWFNKRRGGFEPSRTALFGATIPFMTALTGLGTVTSGSLEWTIAFMRSEEHTSELQSLMRLSYAVFCLKKKNNLHCHNITLSQ